MSCRALLWAAKQRPDTSSEKLVLWELANATDERNDGLAFLCIRTIAERSRLNRKTVIAAIDKLELAKLIADTGERVGRSNQVKVYRLDMERVPKAEPSQKRDSPAFAARGSRKRDTEPLPNKPDSPLGETNVSPAPQGAVRAAKAMRMQEGWTPPDIAALPMEIAALARQWPPGAYQTEAAAFRHHWLAQSGPKAYRHDWNKQWVSRVSSRAAGVLRDAKAGLGFEDFKPATNKSPLEFNRFGEDSQAPALRHALYRKLGDGPYRRYVDRATIIPDYGKVIIRCETVALAQQFEAVHQFNVREALRDELGDEFAGEKIEASKVAYDRSSQRGGGFAALITEDRAARFA